MKLTDGQKAIVAHRGSSLLVPASAGSGKTEVLARRCLSLLSDAARPCGVDQLLVLTFTRAAAAELRVRVAGMLRDAADGAPRESLRAHLGRQAVLIDSAEIGTIDSWCGRLVREHHATAGVDPAFSVLSAEDDVLLRRESLETLVEWIYTASDADAEAARSWVRRNARPSDAFLTDAIDALSRFRDHLVDDERWFAGQLADLSKLDDELRRDAQACLAVALTDECRFQADELDRVVSRTSDGPLAKMLSDYRDALREWQGTLADPARLLDVSAGIAAYRFARRPIRMDESDKLRWEEIKDRWYAKRLRDAWGSDALRPLIDFAPQAAADARTLLQLEQRYQTLLQEQKRRRAAYSFGDVQRMALRLLRDADAAGAGRPSPIALELRRRYEHVLVDEVQDTSPVQFELLRMASREGCDESNAFYVGDVKQSIYAFREAQPELFAAMIAAAPELEGQVKVLSLCDNFRSHRRLVDAVNGMFGRLFDPLLGGIAYDQSARLTACREEPANPALDGAARVELHVVCPPDGDANEKPDDEPAEDDGLPLERIEREAKIAAERIWELKRTGQVPERQPDGSMRLRAVRWSDVAVLLRAAAGHAPLAAAALRKAGIPSVAIGRESMLDSLEVSDVRNILSLLGNRRQDLALSAYLRGPFVQLSPAELLAIRERSPHGTFHDAVLDAAQGEDALAGRVRAAIEQIDRWEEQSRSTDLPMLVRAIIRDGELWHFSRALPAGEHRVAMLQALVDFADELCGPGPIGPPEFVAYLDALESGGARPAAAAAIDDDVVRIMTIHASKGLEFPFVAALGLGSAFSRRSSAEPLLADEQAGLGLSFHDYSRKQILATAAHPILVRRQAERNRSEELRLLYVAATRARERLILVGHEKEGAWEDFVARYAANFGAPPLIERLNARSSLEWAMMAVASGGSGCFAEARESRRDVSEVVVQVHREITDAAPAVESPSTKPMQSRMGQDDDAWIAAAERNIVAVLPTAGSRQAAVLSVSALKQRAHDAGDEPAALLDFPIRLSPPGVSAELSGEEGRIRGTAVHRFLQFVEPRALDCDGLRVEAERLVAENRLSPAELGHLDFDALAWLMQTPPMARSFAQPDRWRRETPFVYALPASCGGGNTIVRGVIDSLVMLDDGLLIVDYKTDRPRDDADWIARIRQYTLQLQLYSLAAAAIFQLPVSGAHLLFLQGRRMVDVDVTPAALERALTLAVSATIASA
ncbi:MAG: UvrD-helicase domain-containing protein [Planctomycetes bacterium]|nr:UvrD-helicase domain-containing protein [Planctomycetota bacterium]